MTRSVARFFSSSYQLRLSEYILLLELRYVTFFLISVFLFFSLSSTSFSPTIVSCQHRVHLHLFHIVLFTKHTKKSREITTN